MFRIEKETRVLKGKFKFYITYHKENVINANELWLN